MSGTLKPPSGFDVIAWAIATGPELSEAERAELEAGSWTEAGLHAARRDPELRAGAGELLASVVEGRADDPHRAILTSGLATALAETHCLFEGLVSDPRFEELSEELRPIARGLAARTVVRVAAADLDQD
jgi:hypothetical protein